jgi:hypothetical protein
VQFSVRGTGVVQGTMHVTPYSNGLGFFYDQGSADTLSCGPAAFGCDIATSTTTEAPVLWVFRGATITCSGGGVAVVESVSCTVTTSVY